MRKDAHALEEPPFGGSSFYLDNVHMYENSRFVRPHEIAGPFDPMDYTSDVPLGNNNPTNVKATMVSGMTYTPLNKPRGRIVSLSNRYEYKGNPFSNADL